MRSLGRAPIGSLGEPADLLDLLSRQIAPAEAGHHQPDTPDVLIPDIAAFEERAAISQFDSGLTLDRAEDLAARAQGFRDADNYWQWLADHVVKRHVPE